MKKIILALLLVFTCHLFLTAQDSLQKAADFYRQGKYSAALGIYEDELKSHPNDPFVYYNIGNCYFKMGSKGLAAANYYRAFRLAPRDGDIRQNLSLTLESGGEKLVPSGIPVILHRAFYWFSYPELKGLVFLIFWLFCAVGSFWLFKGKAGRLTLICAVMLTVCSGWLYLRHQEQNAHLAVIAYPIAEIRSGPGTNFPASASVAQGHLVTVQDAKDSWYEVVVKSQGIKGWVEQNAVEKI